MADARSRVGERASVVEQLEFADVCEMERIAGDAAYTAWLASGRARSSAGVIMGDSDAGVEEVEDRHAEESSHTETQESLL